jgi:hypothetical protein
VQNHDVVIPSVTIRLGGKDRLAILDWNAYAVFERTTGKKLPSLDLANLGITDFLALLHAVLVCQDPDLKLAQVGAWVGPPNQQYVMDMIGELFTQHGPGEDEDDPLVAETISPSSTG